MLFEFYRLRFHFTASSRIYFPPGKSGNILRGAFGSIFRRIACVPQCRDVPSCEIRETCSYARTFEPQAATGPSGLADWPRPFVFRASHLDESELNPGDPFHFDVNLFQLRDPAIAYFVLAFAQLAREGLGPGRGRATLSAVDQLDCEDAATRRLFDGTTLCGTSDIRPSSIPLHPPPDPAARITVRFVTPTELKSGQQIAPQPDFGILMARIRDRVSTLRALYGPGPLEMDFSAFGDRASRVRMTRCDLHPVHITRLSTRTGQRHPLDGFIGAADYEGDLAEFLPFLTAARFTGVGRQTTWGKGEIELRHP